MKPAVAMAKDKNPLEDLGRATLQIVHDLKNQLNGLKLYATFLRKRLEREDRSPEERETILKLIAGLDRAARDMTALVRYSRPVELRRHRADLGKIIIDAGSVLPANHSATGVSLTSEIESGSLYGEFDSSNLSEAFRAITAEVVSTISARDVDRPSLHVRRAGSLKSPEAIVEWRGAKLTSRNHRFPSCNSYGTLHTALAARIIEAHGGRVEFGANIIRAWLPLSE